MSQTYAVKAMIDPATIKYANASHAPRETACAWKPRNSPSSAAVSVSSTPPASICAPELMALAAGSGSLRLRDAATDQLMAATIKAQAPAVSTGASPRLIECPTRTATPAIPTRRATPSRNVRRWVRRKTISPRAMNTGMVAIMTGRDARGHSAFSPEKQPVVENKNQDREKRGRAPLARSRRSCAPGAHPAVEYDSGNQETHARQKKWRNFAHPYADRQEGRAPHQIDNGEGEEHLPCTRLGSSIHGELFCANSQKNLSGGGWAFGVRY